MIFDFVTAWNIMPDILGLFPPGNDSFGESQSAKAHNICFHDYNRQGPLFVSRHIGSNDST